MDKAGSNGRYTIVVPLAMLGMFGSWSASVWYISGLYYDLKSRLEVIDDRQVRNTEAIKALQAEMRGRMNVVPY